MNAAKPRFTVKICGLSNEESLEAAIDAGADMFGLVFHAKSPRHVDLPLAAKLADRARGRIEIVALVVDPDDARLAAIRSAINPDWWQFHGSERFEAVRDRRAVFDLPIMKAIGIASEADLALVAAYARVADRLLLDAKPPEDAAYPGGQGLTFDWHILAALPKDLAFMLSGGLSPENVGDAIGILNGFGLPLLGVDVSSGVESAPGIKDLAKIRAFVAASRAASRRV